MVAVSPGGYLPWGTPRNVYGSASEPRGDVIDTSLVGHVLGIVGTTAIKVKPAAVLLSPLVRHRLTPQAWRSGRSRYARVVIAAGCVPAEARRIQRRPARQRRCRDRT